MLILIIMCIAVILELLNFQLQMTKLFLIFNMCVHTFMSKDKNVMYTFTYSKFRFLTNRV